MHIGSSSRLVTTSDDAPATVLVTLNGLNSMMACVDWLMSGILDRFPQLKVMLSEGGAGWIPYMIERADKAFHDPRIQPNVAIGQSAKGGTPPSQLFAEHMYVCLVDEHFALRALGDLPVDNLVWEGDYPHGDGLWPHNRDYLEKALADVPDDDAVKIAGTTLRGVLRRMSYDLLDGITVIELSLYAFAPSAGAVLADWGADVVKVVPPRVADPMTGVTDRAGCPNVTSAWSSCGRSSTGANAASVSTSRAPKVSRCSTTWSRVPTCSSPTCFRTRAGASASRSTISGRSIHGSSTRRATGHGAAGPERDRGGYDITDFWARSGIGHAASQVSDEFVPLLGPAFGDLTSGAFLAGGIAAALVRRERTGVGAVLDASLLVVGVVGPVAGCGGEPALRHRHHPAVPARRSAEPTGRGLHHRRRSPDLPVGHPDRAPLRELLRGGRPA